MAGENLAPVLARMMMSGAFSDLTFVCKGKEFKVHKVVVCEHSPVINATVQGGLQDSQPTVINMDNFLPNTVKQLVEFMYTGDYEDPSGEHGGSEQAGDAQAVLSGGATLASDPLHEPRPRTAGAADALIYHVCVNSIANYYGVRKLASLVNTKITAICHGQSEDKTWVQMLPTVIAGAMALTGDDELVKTLASATAENISALVGMESFKSLEPITEFSHMVLKSCDRKICALVEELKQAKLQLEHLEEGLAIETSQLMQMTLERTTEKSEFRKCLQVLRSTRVCRNVNCEVEFGAFIDLEERVLRCRRCKCKHKD